MLFRSEDRLLGPLDFPKQDGNFFLKVLTEKCRKAPYIIWKGLLGQFCGIALVFRFNN